MDHHDLGSLSRPLNNTEIELLSQLDRLKFFLATAPSRWSSASSSASSSSNAPGSGNPNHNLGNGASTSSSLSAAPSSHPALNRFLLPSGEYVSCVLWSGLYHITGTDIVRALVFRFEAFGRPVVNMKKFEEGVFSDLRNLKPGTDACLEEPKSPFLDLLFKYQCIRTQKKQKVFYWFSVPHDRLFLDALERDLKREKMGQEPTTVTRGEPALSFKYDPKRTLYEQFLKATAQEGNGDEGDEDASPTAASFNLHGSLQSHSQRPTPRMGNSLSVVSPADIINRRLGSTQSQGIHTKQEDDADGLLSPTAYGQSSSAKQPFLSMFSLFEGSPTYKQRRKKASGKTASAHNHGVVNARRVSSLASLSGVVRTAGSSGSQSNVPSRRSSMLSMGSTELGPIHSQQHPSLAGHQYQDISAPGSRPQSQQQHLQPPHQQLGSYGLSMNPHVEPRKEDNEYDRRPSLPNSDDSYPQNMQEQQSQQQNQMIKAFMCPLLSCRLLFHRSEHLKKHMRTHAMRQIVRPHTSGSLIYPCDRGCGKVFSRADNLRLHQTGCRGAASAGIFAVGELTGSETGGDKEDAMVGSGNGDDPAQMELEAEYQEVEVPSSSAFEDDPYGHYTHANSASPPPSMTPSSTGQNQHLALHTDTARLHGPRSDGINTPQYVLGTSAENSPYVETPEGGATQWANLPNGQHGRIPQPLQFHHQRLGAIAVKPIHPLHHQMSHHNLGMTSPPGSAHSTHGSAFTQQQALHPQSTRFQSPASEVGVYNAQHQQGFVHPSSAPSHKATFDHASLYPPPYGSAMVGLSLRRHRSATPMIGGGGRIGGNEQSLVQQAHIAGIDSRPASSAGGESNYGSVIASNAHPFAYSIDSGDGRGSAMGYVPPGSGVTGLASTVGASRPASDHSSSPGAPYGGGEYNAPEYETSGSPYDGSNGSPGSAGHAMTGISMNAHPQEQAPQMIGIPGHSHSLSSEIATQQMQQYVDFDGMAEGSTEGQYASANTGAYSHPYQQGHVRNEISEAQQQQYTEAQRYPQAHGEQHVGAYHSTGSENGSHEEMYTYQHYPQQHHSLHVSHHMNYGYPPEVGAAQQVAL